MAVLVLLTVTGHQVEGLGGCWQVRLGWSSWRGMAAQEAELWWRVRLARGLDVDASELMCDAPATAFDKAHVVRDNDCTAPPRGYHPDIAAGGYRLFLTVDLGHVRQGGTVCDRS